MQRSPGAEADGADADLDEEPTPEDFERVY